MEVKKISWRQAVQYGIQAKQAKWIPTRITFEIPANTVMVPFNESLAITEVRDWVFSSVGEFHILSAMFNAKIKRSIPDFLCLDFNNYEDAMLFKLTWY